MANPYHDTKGRFSSSGAAGPGQAKGEAKKAEKAKHADDDAPDDGRFAMARRLIADAESLGKRASAAAAKPVYHQHQTDAKRVAATAPKKEGYAGRNKEGLAVFNVAWSGAPDTAENRRFFASRPDIVRGSGGVRVPPPPRGFFGNTRPTFAGAPPTRATPAARAQMRRSFGLNP